MGEKDKDIMNRPECEGCRSLNENYNPSCIIMEKLIVVNKTSEKKLNCPCELCLIKPMCKTGCSDYSFLRTTLIKRTFYQEKLPLQ